MLRGAGKLETPCCWQEGAYAVAEHKLKNITLFFFYIVSFKCCRTMPQLPWRWVIVPAAPCAQSGVRMLTGGYQHHALSQWHAASWASGRAFCGSRLLVLPVPHVQLVELLGFPMGWDRLVGQSFGQEQAAVPVLPRKFSLLGLCTARAQSCCPWRWILCLLLLHREPAGVIHLARFTVR